VNGFFQVERNLLERLGQDNKLTAADFRVLAAAMRNSKLPGDGVTLGINYLAAATRLDRSSVIRSRKRLLALGYLSGIEKGKRGIARFVVARGGVDATPEAEHDDERGGVDATPRGGVRATQRDTTTKQETTTSLSKNEIPEREGSDNPLPFPQGNQTTPPLTPPAAGPAKKPRRKANEHPTWLRWLKVNQDAGQPKPLEEKSSLTAAKTMAEQIPNSEEQEAIMWEYVKDKTDVWVINRGLTLSDLVKYRLSKCRTAAARAIKEQAASDAELIRGAEMAFPDPDERAAFWQARKDNGLRVPPGVECRPMPIEFEKEEAI
jgi:hypothetical protein